MNSQADTAMKTNNVEPAVASTGRLRGVGMRLVSRILWSTLYAVTIVPIAFGNGVALAADIYVDAVNGSDGAGDGTVGNPYQSIGQGLLVAVSGDTVRAQPGDYDQALETFPLEMVPGVSVVAEEGTLVTFISTDNDDTLVSFADASFDAATTLQGFNLRGTDSTAHDGATGVLMDADGAASLSIAPVIQDNVFSALENGIELDGTNESYPGDLSPVIHNNVFQSIQERAITGYASDANTMSPSITQNLIDSSFTNDDNSYGVYFWAEGGDGDDAQGSVINVDIDSNVILRSYYSIYLYAGAGDETTVAPRVQGGLPAEVASTVGSDVVSAVLAPNPFGGTVNANVVNNRLGSLDNMYTVGISAFSEGYDDQGGNMNLTASKNTLFSGYGVYLATFSFFADNVDGYGPKLTAEISDNLMDSTYYDDSFHTGVYVNADGNAAEVEVTVRNNEITNGYGVILEADGSSYSPASGGRLNATIEDNLIDGSTFNETTYGVFMWADGGQGSGGDSGGGGLIDASLRRNDITATYGVYIEAEGGDCCSGVGLGGEVDATIDSNTILAFNQYQEGQGIYAGAREASGSSPYTGGSFDLTITNNLIRAYDGISLFVDGYSNDATDSGKGSASIVNNTILGGGIGYNYEDGYAIVTEGGTDLSPFHPVIDNNILIVTPETYAPPVYLGFNVDSYSDPASLDNNDLLSRRLGGPVASLRSTYFFSTGVVNTFPFADDNISVEPNFACENQGNARLLATSPLIDAGKPNGLTGDFEGDLRPIGAGIDIGADEYNGTKLGTTFQDVGPDSGFYLFVEALAAAGITGGCKVSPPLYCPSQVVSREQMAVFIIRALGAAPDSTGAPLFSDVPSSRFSFPYIQTLATLGVTGGCGGGNYCPLAPVTRAEMAVFLIRALGETPDGSLPAIFGDVAPGGTYYPYIQRLAKIGVTGGCAPGAYCPDSPVTREQMAAFIVRAFDLPVPLPCVGRVADRSGVQPGVAPEGTDPELSRGEVSSALQAGDPATVLVSSSGESSGRGARVIDRGPIAARGASAAVGPVSNRYLKLTAAQRDRLTAKRATSTPRRDQLKGKPATDGMTRKQFDAELSNRIAAFEANWQAGGRDLKHLNPRKLRAMLAREMRYPAASKPVDVDRFVMKRQALKAKKVRGKRVVERQLERKGVNATASDVTTPQGGRQRGAARP